MKKSVKLSTKLIVSFGIILALTIFISISSSIGLSLASTGFSQYRDLALETNLNGRIQANMLKAELSVQGFIESGEEKYVKDYKESEAIMNKLIDENDSLILDKERKTGLKVIKDEFINYATTFEKIQGLYKQRDELVNIKLFLEGANMLNSLSDVIKSAYDDNDIKASYYAGNILKHSLLGRIYVFRYIDTSSKEEIEKANKELIGNSIITFISEFEKNIVNTNRIEVFNKYKEARKNYLEYFDDLIQVISERDRLIETELNRIGPLVANKIDEMTLSVKTNQDELGLRVLDFNQYIITAIIFIATISVLIAIVIIFIILRSVNKTLGEDPSYLASIANEISKGILTIDSLRNNDKKKIGLFKDMAFMADTLEKKSRTIEKIANGDLSVDIDLASKDDEVGNSLIKMVDTLNEIIQQINLSVQQVNQGSIQVAEASQNLSQGSSEQAASLEEVTASLTEISSQIQENTEGAIKTHKLSLDTLDNANKGDTQMRELIKAMENINNSANEIKKIVKIIDDIASQTNLLALNADIEAARVGKYGRGFAVVANSVRNLASKSQKSVKETTEMVEQALKNIEKGTQLVELTSKQLEEIRKGANDVASISNSVSESSQEQTRGIEQISTALSQVEDVVQSNSANAEENAAASEELSAQAKRLRELISYFRVREENLLNTRSQKYINSNEKKELVPVE